MKDVVPTSNLTTIDESLMSLNNEFRILLSQYKKLKKKFYKLKNKSEIHLPPSGI